jgi:hypothetical protein
MSSLVELVNKTWLFIGLVSQVKTHRCRLSLKNSQDSTWRGVAGGTTGGEAGQGRGPTKPLTRPLSGKSSSASSPGISYLQIVNDDNMDEANESRADGQLQRALKIMGKIIIHRN